MEYRKLGRTDIEVSALCLGSMTWGTQNTEAEGHAQIDMALDHGINFIDTAEMYPVNPTSADTSGDTEAVIGTWLASRARRSDVVIATKVIGEGYPKIRDGGPITPETIRIALDDSLKRLQTDYVDLYQLHWPNRGSFHFRKHWRWEPPAIDVASEEQEIADILGALGDEIARGRIRAIGLSNESSWGVMKFLQAAETRGLPRMASIQNEYSLLCRHFDLDLGEIAVHEQCGLLAFSPLAAGILSGKYQGDATPQGTRRALSPELGGRWSPACEAATGAYLEVAREHGLHPVQMALAFCVSRPFMTSVIFGATSLGQLEVAIGAARITLSAEVLDAIAAARRLHPMPM